MVSIANPWAGFEHSEYMVHSDDEDSFKDHNSRVKLAHRFIPFLAPEPWIGNVDSKVVILLANPGATKENLVGDRESNPFRQELAIKNLHMEKMGYPHYFLDPSLHSDPGGKWWRSTLGKLIKDTSLENVSQNVLSLEALPYHSRYFETPALEIPTQRFTAQLLREAINREAFIVIYRQSDYWISQVPELKKYPRKTMNPINTQRVWITPGNLRNGYEEIVNLIAK